MGFFFIWLSCASLGQTTIQFVAQINKLTEWLGLAPLPFQAKGKKFQYFFFCQTSYTVRATDHCPWWAPAERQDGGECRGTSWQTHLTGRPSKRNGPHLYALNSGIWSKLCILPVFFFREDICAEFLDSELSSKRGGYTGKKHLQLWTVQSLQDTDPKLLFSLDFMLCSQMWRSSLFVCDVTHRAIL